MRKSAIILTVVATLLLIYPLSFGPMFWLCSDSGNRVGGDFKSKAFLEFYRPVIWALQEGPQSIRTALGRYLDIWEK
ncbi:MAG: hypothetical protein IAF94_04170 [Pirellulaceae bacterium]|nr:hypothetical protein [Pirellulaceae bacterium]